jgi:hypothetical protein
VVYTFSYGVVDVAHTWAQLEELTIKIARDEPDWRAQGVILGRWGPSAELNKVLIELRSPTRAAAQALYAAYGEDWITVSPEPFTQELIFTGGERAPAGAAIWRGTRT